MPPGASREGGQRQPEIHTRMQHYEYKKIVRVFLNLTILSFLKTCQYKSKIFVFSEKIFQKIKK